MADAAPNSPPESFREVIGLWPSYEALSEAIGAPVATVRKWAFRDRIPEGWWQSLIDAAPSGAVTADLLVRLAAKAPAEQEAAE